MKNAMMVATLCTLTITSTAQVFDNMTIDSIASGLRSIENSVALDMPFVLSMDPQGDVNGKFLFVGTIYDRHTDIDVTGYNEETEFGDLGYTVYDQLNVGESATFFEERCFTFQYMDLLGQVGNATTLCITQDFVDYLIDNDQAHVENGAVVSDRPLRTERGYDTTVHLSWIENAE